MAPRSAPVAADRNRCRMSEPARIGPNAILQMMPVLERMAGPDGALRMLRQAGVSALPDGTEMIPEGDAARLHQWLRATMREEAASMAHEAGEGTARYILAHRIPKPAQALLRILPPELAAWSLSRAIAKHAWTFAGSGKFRVRSPWQFAIEDNPIVRGEQNADCLCHWHAAVFERLYRDLVHPDVTCREIACCAQPGQWACVFALSRGNAGGEAFGARVTGKKKQ